MVLHLLKYHDCDSPSGTVEAWFTSKRSAQQFAAKLRRDYKGNSDFFIHGAVEQINVPTTRVALCEFLNQRDGT